MVMPIIVVLSKLRQENWEFTPSLGYIVRPYVKTVKGSKSARLAKVT